jgi:hypothetical protein
VHQRKERRWGFPLLSIKRREEDKETIREEREERRRREEKRQGLREHQHIDYPFHFPAKEERRAGREGREKMGFSVSLTIKRRRKEEEKRREEQKTRREERRARRERREKRIE